LTEWRPTPKQRAALEAASEMGLRRSVSAICNAAGVSRESFYRWMRDDANFREAWDTAWQSASRRQLNGVLAAMVERALSGDVPAARLVAELAGAIKQKHEHSGTDGRDLMIRVVYGDDTDPADGATAEAAPQAARDS
jgi:AcrR family transcriptional regulator